MSEVSLLDEKTLNLVAKEESSTRQPEGSELFNKLYEALHPQAQNLLDQAGALYRQATEQIMRLVPGDWDRTRFPEPATEPIPVSLVQLLDKGGNPARTLEMKIRGKGQIALAHSDIQGKTQNEHLFQRINPIEITDPDVRAKCAEAIREAQNKLLDKNESIFQDPAQHAEQITKEIEAFEQGLDLDIWIPFEAQGKDGDGDQATHLIDWGGRRPTEITGSYLADMANESAYRDNPDNMANIVAEHQKNHPIADVFKANCPDGVPPAKHSGKAVNLDATMFESQAIPNPKALEQFKKIVVKENPDIAALRQVIVDEPLSSRIVNSMDAVPGKPAVPDFGVLQNAGEKVNRVFEDAIK